MKPKPLTPRQVRGIRKSLGMTQKQLAVALGKHRTTVARWELGSHSVGLSESAHLRLVVAELKGAVA